MITYAYVKSADEKYITLRMPDPKTCASSAVFKAKPHEFKIANSLNSIPDIGDIAKLNLDTKKSILLSVLLFGLPLLIFALVFGALRFFSISEELAALIALIIMPISFFINYKIFSINKFDVEILEISKDAEIEICKNCNKCKN